MTWPDRIRACFESQAILYTSHARAEMRSEEFGQIADQEVDEALSGCEAIEEYPDDTPYPSVLLLGENESGRPIHAVCAYAPDDQVMIIITVYEPDPDRWDDNRRRKR